MTQPKHLPLDAPAHTTDTKTAIATLKHSTPNRKTQQRGAKGSPITRKIWRVGQRGLERAE